VNVVVFYVLLKKKKKMFPLCLLIESFHFDQVPDLDLLLRDLKKFVTLDGGDTNLRVVVENEEKQFSHEREERFVESDKSNTRDDLRLFVTPIFQLKGSVLFEKEDFFSKEEINCQLNGVSLWLK